MIHLLVGTVLPLLFCWFAFTSPCAGSDGVPPAENVRLARELMRDGNTGEAVSLLTGTLEEHPAWDRAWEARVLLETCRQALGAPSTAPAPAVGGGGQRLRVAQVLLFEGERVEDIAANLARLKEAGVNTVFVRVFHNQGDRSLFRGGPSARSGVYFRTAAAPMLRDYLSEIIPLCRRLGLSIFAWMTTRRSEWILHEDPGLAELTYDPPTDRVLRSRSLNIFHPRVVERLSLLYRDLAAYDIDGILFQDDLVLRAGEGLSPEAIAAYMEDGGPTVSPGTLFRLEGRNPGTPLFSPDNYRPAFWDWAAWKNRRLLELAWELMDAAREVRPGLRFALNLYYEAVLNPRMALAWYAQDLKAAQGYPFDYYSLMSYHRQIGKELSLSGEEALGVLSTMSRRAVRAVGRPEKIIMKIQALDWDTQQIIPREELDRALEAAAPVEGISLAFVRSRSDPPLDVIRKHFLIRE
jgi:biofilm PGA synthesis lipoprotein PgaB